MSPFSHPGNFQEIIDGKLLFFKYTFEKILPRHKTQEAFPYTALQLARMTPSHQNPPSY